MNKTIMIQRIAILYPKFLQFYKTGTFRPTKEEIKAITELARELNPKLPLQINTGCGSCMRDAIKSLSNWYDKVPAEEKEAILNPPVVEDPQTETDPETTEDTQTEDATSTEDTPKQTQAKKTRKSNKIYSEDVNKDS